MKLNFKLVFSIGIIILLGCNSNYNKLIVGTWIPEYDVKDKYTFYNNKTYSFFYSDGIIDKGIWGFEGARLILTKDNGQQDIWRIKSLTNYEFKGEMYFDFNHKIPYTWLKLPDSNRKNNNYFNI